MPEKYSLGLLSGVLRTRVKYKDRIIFPFKEQCYRCTEVCFVGFCGIMVNSGL